MCAAYLARGGLRTLLVEARIRGRRHCGSERSPVRMVNICNCDHVTFRTTPVIDELGLADHGLRYLDDRASPDQHGVERRCGVGELSLVEQTLDSIGRNYPGEVDGYRRYLKAAMPAIRLVLDAANDPPSLGGADAQGARRVAVAASARCCGGVGAAPPT